MELPSLFGFATGELSQDAFICWLASWADPQYRAADEPLHATATAFLDRLLEVGGLARPPSYTSVRVQRQFQDIDVLLLLNDDIALVIEDKTDTKDHSDQLRRYKKVVIESFPGHRIAAVYLKTGDQCDYRSAEQAGYGCYLRRDFLAVLDRGVTAGVTNDIFLDFHNHLRAVEHAVQAFSTLPIREWQGEQWRGFFMALRQALGDGEWLRSGHGGGGTPTFRWHRRGDKFLRLGEGELAFKVEASGVSDGEAKWLEWNRVLRAGAGTGGIKLRNARRKLGRRMTVAVLDGDYRQTDADGRLDFDRTVEVLRDAEKVMDAALGPI